MLLSTLTVTSATPGSSATLQVVLHRVKDLQQDWCCVQGKGGILTSIAGKITWTRLARPEHGGWHAGCLQHVQPSEKLKTVVL